MDIRDQLLRHRKDTRFIVGGLLLLLLVCSAVYLLLQRGEGVSSGMMANKLLLFVLWYINVILILTILFILVRNFFRLLLERHHRILGSKFKTKLVAAAISLSLVPVLILFPFTVLLLRSFDQWFSLPVEEVVDQAKETAEYLSQVIETTNLRDTQRVIDSLADIDIADLTQIPRLQAEMQSLLEELQLDYLAVYDGVDFVHSTAVPQAGFSSDPSFRGIDNFLLKAIERGAATRVLDSLSIGQLILAARSLGLPTESEELRHLVVIAGTVLPPDIAVKSQSLLLAHQRYQRQLVQKEEIQASYLLNLLMVTLLVILLFSSIGMRLARRLTTPIQALAEGTRRIRSGDLEHHVEAAVDDELAVLVDGFNEMTSDLKANKQIADQSRRKLKSSNRRLATVLQNVAAGVISLDNFAVVTTCNGAALEILRQREADVIGKEIYQIWSDRERGKLVVLLEQKEDPERRVASQLHLTIGGVLKTLEVKVSTLPGPDGKSAGRVIVLEDLTELIHAQKMATWNEVARRIAHEIKNPLTPIKLTAERLLRKHQQGNPELGTALEQGVAIIVREVSSLKSMVDEFSRFARMRRPHPQEIDLERLFGETLHLYRELKPGVEVESSVDPRASAARFDPEQLKSVLINLLDNAIEATDAPGQVALSTSRSDETISIHIADTGAGISTKDKEKVFLPYFSTKGRGTGLGLAIVHRIVTDHHATIRVEDNEPHGAIFTLEIPAL